MDQPNAPPLTLDSARVIAYAVVDSDVQWTDRQRLYVNDQLLGAVPCMAIGQNVFDDEEFLLLLCDSDWNVLGVVPGSSEAEIKDRAERWYKGITKNWVTTDTTREAAEESLRQESVYSRCSFCGTLSTQVETMFASKIRPSESPVFICSICVGTMYQMLSSTEN